MPRRLRSRGGFPWADLVLFLVIGGVIALWWLHPPATQPTARLLTATAGPALALLPEPSATPLPPSPTPEPADTRPVPTPSPTSLPGPIRHKVAAGDTVALIAGLYGSTIQDIIQANNLPANGFIRVGQELLVPVPGPSGGPGPVPTLAGGTLIYSVNAGDTLVRIAARFNSRVEWILQANGLKPTDILQVGQALQIPSAPITPAPTITSTLTISVPTALPSVIPTATAGLRFRAPALLTPPEGSLLTGAGDALLTWTSVGLLAENEWYVVTLTIGGDDGLEAPFTKPRVPPYWTKGTSWRLPAEYRLPGPAATEFAWQVQVLTGSPERPEGPASPPSMTRHFTWR